MRASNRYTAMTLPRARRKVAVLQASTKVPRTRQPPNDQRDPNDGGQGAPVNRGQIARDHPDEQQPTAPATRMPKATAPHSRPGSAARHGCINAHWATAARIVIASPRPTSNAISAVMSARKKSPKARCPQWPRPSHARGRHLAQQQLSRTARHNRGQREHRAVEPGALSSALEHQQ